MFRTTKSALKTTFESERRYRRLVNHSPDAIAVHQDGLVVFANPACAKLMGVESNGMVLAASSGKALAVLTQERDVPPGSKVS